MKIHLSTLFALQLLVACEGMQVEQQAVESSAASGDFTWDTSRLHPIPPGTIPSNRLQLSAFAGEAIRSQLIQTDEPMTETDQNLGRLDYQSPSWQFSTEAGRGLVLAVNKNPAGPPSNPSESQLQNAAIQRLQAWGIGGGEVGPVWQRRLMATPEDDGSVGPPSRAGYKTFVIRSILGVRVGGHRAVVSHGLDGSFRRVIADWPALAPSGHLLHTTLTLAQIKDRAANGLNAEGFTSGLIRLGWRYVPIANSSGEVRLELRAVARTAGQAGGGMGEEPYEVDVDVSAVP